MKHEKHIKFESVDFLRPAAVHGAWSHGHVCLEHLNVMFL